MLPNVRMALVSVVAIALLVLVGFTAVAWVAAARQDSASVLLAARRAARPPEPAERLQPIVIALPAARVSQPAEPPVETSVAETPVAEMPAAETAAAEVRAASTPVVERTVETPVVVAAEPVAGPARADDPAAPGARPATADAAALPPAPLAGMSEPGDRHDAPTPAPMVVATAPDALPSAPAAQGGPFVAEKPAVRAAATKAKVVKRVPRSRAVARRAKPAKTPAPTNLFESLFGGR